MGIVATKRAGPDGYSSFAVEDSPHGTNVDVGQVKDLTELEDIVRSAHFTTTTDDSLKIAEEAVRVAESAVFGSNRDAYGILRDGLEKKIADCRLTWRNQNFLSRCKPMIILGLIGASLFILRQVLSLAGDGTPGSGFGLSTVQQNILNYIGDFGQGIGGIALGTVLAFGLRSSRMGPDAASYLRWYGLPPRLYAVLVVLVGLGLYIVVKNGWVDVTVGGNGSSLQLLAQDVPFLFGFLVGLFEKPLGDLVESVLGGKKP